LGSHRNTIEIVYEGIIVTLGIAGVTPGKSAAPL
jgi:hypothetical protein